MATNEKNSFEAAAAAVQTMRRKEVTGELNFITDLKKLNKKLEKDNIVARFPDPEGGDPIDFEMRPMTPGETAIYYQTLLGHTLMEAGAGTPDPEYREPDDAETQKLQDELAVKKYDTKLLNILESCIINYPGLTAGDMREWEPFYVMSLHNALIEGSRPSKAVAQFPDVDSAGGE